MDLKLSCCTWGLNEGSGLLRYWRRYRGKRVSETQSLSRLAGLGFRTADITPSMLQSNESRQIVKNLNLHIACVSISHEAPPGSTFDSDESTVFDPLIIHTQKGIDHTSELGAALAYVVPGKPGDDRTSFRYADHYASLAEYGQDRGIKIGIEHFPGTAFPSVKKTLDFIREVDHPNLYLLFDIGHAQISEEDPVEAIELAGDRLVYVHLDDNDGKDDLHLPLTEGVQSEESLKRFFLGLRNCGYSGHVSLEMHPKLPNPFNAIKQSKAVVENCW